SSAAAPTTPRRSRGACRWPSRSWPRRASSATSSSTTGSRTRSTSSFRSSAPTSPEGLDSRSMGARMIGRGMRTAALAPLAAVLVSLALNAPPALAGGPCVGCSGTYSGSWSATYQRLEHHGGEQEEHATITISLKWAAALTFQGGEDVW